MATHKHTNTLVNETSPYLLQHAHNPVDWRAWNQESLALARRQDRPILLSIGYSACHWCHVMEHECFEDEGIAAYMNEHFVCIKVDREERPDLDKLYQVAHHMLTRRAGGWPLNVVITPDTHAPFFAGTYFPKVPRHGMPSFKDVLQKVGHYYRTHRDELHEHTNSIKSAFAQAEPEQDSDIAPDAAEKAVADLMGYYDPVHGGFGGAPKFPHPTNIELCLRNGASRHAGRQPDPAALDAARHTLAAMAGGGVYDQLGGGFYRYSVDGRWSIPHFEKMLYDNAQLLPLYADAWLITGDVLFRDTALSTSKWVMREMQSDDGGFYSTLDADSEGEEGRFYTWTPQDIEDILPAEEYAVAAIRFGLNNKPNFEGKWHLNIDQPLEAVARLCGVDVQRCTELLDQAKRRLYDARQSRVRPATDDKILSSWNAMMIKGMAHAGRLLHESELISSATRALDYLHQNLFRQGRLLATSRGKKAHLNAYLDDHVLLIEAIIELNQSRWRCDEMELAVSLAETVLERFEDRARGAYFFTADDHEQLLHRTKPASDDATPSGNGIAVRVLTQLGHLLGDNRYLESAERALRLMSPTMKRHPSAHGTLVMAADEFQNPPNIVIIRGDAGASAGWLRVLAERYRPRTLVFVIPDAPGLPGILNNMKRTQSVTAYLCSGSSCSAPIETLEQFASAATDFDIQ